MTTHTGASAHEIFRRDVAGARHAFWVDRPDGSVLMGSSDTVASYRFGGPDAGVWIDGELVSEDLWDWLDSLAATGETWVGYLGYGVKAVTRGGIPHQLAGEAQDGPPDALWMRADRLIPVPPSPLGEQAEMSPSTPGEQAEIFLPAHRGGEGEEESARQRYLDDIAVIKGHLARGESYEVCLTRLVDVVAPGDPFETFLRMRAASPTARSVYLRSGDLAICSATPEEFLTVTADGAVRSSPIKGTAPRGADPQQDAELAQMLCEDPKTRAENLMIVDLVRNDLHQVCIPGTVAVPRFLEVETYATVHQLVSTVTGTLAPGQTRIDAVRAAFPPGSMTGAPKERTMAIIDALEPQPRGIYSGAIGILEADGSADLRVVIRTAVIDSRRGTASVGTGGAIVWASDPDAEWAETELKAAAVLRALRPWDDAS